MADAKRDQNSVTTLLALSNADGSTPIALWADPTTHRLLVSSSGITLMTATGTVNDANRDFTFTSQPTIIVVNGMSYRVDHGWTWSSPTATLESPVGTGGDIYGIA